jgi:sodium-independent sulfate anion transporter 11
LPSDSDFCHISFEAEGIIVETEAILLSIVVSVGAGFLVQFVSVPVVAGFTSASAIIIASSQVKGLFGLSYNSEGFVESWTKLFGHIGSTRLWDTVLSGSCIIILLCLRVRNSDFCFRMMIVVF